MWLHLKCQQQAQVEGQDANSLERRRACLLFQHDALNPIVWHLLFFNITILPKKVKEEASYGITNILPNPAAQPDANPLLTFLLSILLRFGETVLVQTATPTLCFVPPTSHCFCVYMQQVTNTAELVSRITDWKVLIQSLVNLLQISASYNLGKIHKTTAVHHTSLERGEKGFHFLI